MSSADALADSPAALLRAVPATTREVVEPLLVGLRGGLLLDVSEPGANVSIDGRLLGTTPLDGQLALAPGPHLVEVTKEGFLPFRREVEIHPDQTLAQEVTLSPSPEFIERYERRNGRLRTGAWMATAVTLAGAGATLLFQQQAQSLYGTADEEGTFLFHRARISGDDEVGDHAHWTEASQLRARIEQRERLSS